jgi:hypothetical protein
MSASGWRAKSGSRVIAARRSDSAARSSSIVTIAAGVLHRRAGLLGIRFRDRLTLGEGLVTRQPWREA